MDVKDIKNESDEYFENYINLYYEIFKDRFSKKCICDLFKYFQDPAGRFMFPFIFDIYHFVEREFPDKIDNDIPLEPWEQKKYKAYIEEKIKEMQKEFTDFVFQGLILKVYLNLLEISDA